MLWKLKQAVELVPLWVNDLYRFLEKVFIAFLLREVQVLRCDLYAS